MRRLAVVVVVFAVLGCSTNAGQSPTPQSTARVVALTTPTSESSLTRALTPSPTSAPSPTSDVAACTGTDANRAYFIQTAATVPFNFYCAVFPTGWQVKGTQTNQGVTAIVYSNTSGWFVELEEGCSTAAECLTDMQDPIGSTRFGDMTGTIYSMNLGYEIWSQKGGTGYAMMASRGGISDPNKITQAQFSSWAAAIIQVSKA
jgi:hypothetical protein